MIISPPGTESFGPEAETRVPCPACGKGMVTGKVDALVKEALKDEPQPLIALNTDTMAALPDRDPCRNGHQTCPHGCNRCLLCEYCKCTHAR